MSRIGKALLLLICFSVDVQVRAASPVIRASVKRTFSAGSFVVHMAAGSLLEQRDESTFQILDGQFLAELPSGVRLQTPFATFHCIVPRCEALVNRERLKVEVRALKGGLVVRRVGEKRDYLLAPAMRLVVMPVTGEGAAEMEFPQSLPWDSTVKDWARLFPGTPAEFKATLIQFREDWRRAVDQASQIHHQFATRELASFERQLAEERARKAAQQREDEELRRLFRMKNFIDP